MQILNVACKLPAPKARLVVGAIVARNRQTDPKDQILEALLSQLSTITPEAAEKLLVKAYATHSDR